MLTIKILSVHLHARAPKMCIWTQVCIYIEVFNGCTIAKYTLEWGNEKQGHFWHN